MQPEAASCGSIARGSKLGVLHPLFLPGMAAANCASAASPPRCAPPRDSGGPAVRGVGAAAASGISRAERRTGRAPLPRLGNEPESPGAVGRATGPEAPCPAAAAVTAALVESRAAKKGSDPPAKALNACIDWRPAGPRPPARATPGRLPFSQYPDGSCGAAASAVPSRGAPRGARAAAAAPPPHESPAGRSRAGLGRVVGARRCRGKAAAAGGLHSAPAGRIRRAASPPSPPLISANLTLISANLTPVFN